MPGLIERSAEVSAVEELLVGAEGGAGQTLLFSGQAGVGKSTLIAHAREEARSRGFTVLSSCPTPVSAALAHAVVRDWVGPLSQVGRAGVKPFDGPASGLAYALADTGDDESAWSLNGLDYAISWLLENLCEQGPLLLVVDDVQWADGGSLQILDLLSARLSTSPIGLLLARRTGESSLRPDILERIAARSAVVSPQPLTVIGVDQMRQELPTAPQMSGISSAELHRLTGGLPFLVREVLRSSDVAPGSAPRTVVESVRGRLERLGEPTLEIARTVALLGDEASFDALGDLCGLTVAELADPLEVLTDADLVTLGLWRVWPAHPLISEAVLASMSPSERSERHRQAASYLAKVDRPRQVVASHLVNTLPREDRGVVEVLTRAAEESLDSGAPLVAAAQLLRAVGELKPADTDPQLIRLAASAHMRAGLVDEALDLWSRALSRMVTPEDQALCLADIGDARMTLGDREAARASYEEANQKLRQAGHDSSSQVLRLLVARMGRAQAIFDGGHSAVEGIIADALNQPVSQDTHADRLLFALAGSALAFEGRDARRARELALRAEARGGLLAQESCDGSGFYIVTGVLTWTDSFDEVLEALTAAVEESRSTGSSLGFATASYCRGYAYYRKGDLRNAVTDLDAALAMRARGWNEYVEAALAGLAFAHLDLGQLEEARALEPELREVAKRDELISAFALAAAGRIRASDNDHERALEDYRAAGRLMGPFRNPALVDWRELSTWSLKELGREDEARAAAKEAVTLARQWGSPRAIGFALRALGEVASSAASDRLLREAAHHFDSCGAVDQLARTRLSLGASLMRSPGTRAEGITLVRAALDYGRQADVPPIMTEASRVLLQYGLKVAEPAGSPLHTLTPGERRVVELAATGRTNRTIAQELFVTVKAVEWHLSNAYRKLSISSRAQLPEIIASHSGGATSAALSSSAR